MCGICGQFNFDGRAEVSREDIGAMTSSLAHRGPDDEGFFVSGSIGLGFRRLSIIDLSGGHQPMSDAEKSVWLIFNGEIYNFKELRAQLESFGYVFRTDSDTEVIIHGYKQWGDDVLQHLNGMFGLALWDTRKRRLLVARDRMGIKVVYYKIDSGQLSFGSEIRSILAALPEKPSINPAAIESFLRYRYTPSPSTIIDGIQKLAAGECLIAEDGELPKVRRWWNFTPAHFDPMPGDEEAAERLLDIYSSAVKRHLISDVPVGLLLSGGLDSALLLALMTQSGKGWRTFTAGYGATFADDELQDASQTARAFGAVNTPVEINCAVFEESIAKIAATLEEPVATSSVIPMYFLCQRTRQDVKVALIGQGPDELFGGYPRHLGVEYGRYWRALPGPGRALLKSVLGMIPRNESVHRALYSLDARDRLTRYQQVFSILPQEVIGKLFRQELSGGENQLPEYWNQMRPLMANLDELGGLQFLEIRSSLPDELLVYADKLSMAHGLELRVPYLDQEIVEYVERLNASFKIRHGKRKWLHQRVAKSFLPREILRRKKRGFASNVVDEWFRKSLSAGMEQIFHDPQSLIYNYLRVPSVLELLHEHKTRRLDNHKTLFSLIMLEYLLRHYDAAGKVPYVPDQLLPQVSSHFA